MTVGPRRLNDDPDFKWETGCDLSDERGLVGDYDLAGLRSRLVAAAAASPAPGVGDGVPSVRPGKAPVGSKPWPWRSGAGFVAGAAVVAAAYWLGIHSGSSDVELIAVPVPVPVTAPVAPPAPSTDGRGGQDGQDAVQPAATSPGPSVGPSVGSASSPAGRLSPGGAVPTKSAPPTIATPAPAQVAATQTEGTADAGPAAAAPTGSVRAAPPSSELAIELQVFEPARDSLVDGDFAAAKTGFERYLAQLPHGRMVGEAQIGRLQASKGLNDPAATASLAEKLQDLPELAGRRQEILRLRAESLVLLDRCDEALLVASDLSTRDASEIRRACRATRRE